MKINELISLRKLNSLLIVIIILILLYHAILSVLYLMGIIAYSPNFQISGEILFDFLVLHIVLSLYLFFRDRLRRKIVYPKLIKETRQQIFTGLLIIIFMILHIVNYLTSPVNSIMNYIVIISHYLVDNLLFITIALHLRVSIPRLLVSFGFLVEKESYQKVKKNTNIIIGIILLLFMIAEIMFYLL